VLVVRPAAAGDAGRRPGAQPEGQPGSGLTLLASTTDGALNALDVTVAGIFSTGVPEIDRRWSTPTSPPRSSCW
jgi:hypothetical protein